MCSTPIFRLKRPSTIKNHLKRNYDDGIQGRCMSSLRVTEAIETKFDIQRPFLSGLGSLRDSVTFLTFFWGGAGVE